MEQGDLFGDLPSGPRRVRLNSLQAAREYVREHCREGVRCPCCEQFVKVYRLHSLLPETLEVTWEKMRAVLEAPR